MRKIQLMFIVFIAFISVSYASFPVYVDSEINSDTLQTEEIKQYHYNLLQMNFDLAECRCVSCREGVAPLVSKLPPLPKKKEVVEIDDLPKKDSRPIIGLISSVLSVGLFFSAFAMDELGPAIFLSSFTALIGFILGLIGMKKYKKRNKIVSWVSLVVSSVVIFFLSWLLIMINMWSSSTP